MYSDASQVEQTGRSGSRKSGRCLVCVIFLFVQWISSADSSFAAALLPPTHIDDFTGPPRVVVISDIGNEPDDQMSFVRFLLYSNEFEIEANDCFDFHLAEELRCIRRPCTR